MPDCLGMIHVGMIEWSQIWPAAFMKSGRIALVEAERALLKHSSAAVYSSGSPDSQAIADRAASRSATISCQGADPEPASIGKARFERCGRRAEQMVTLMCDGRGKN